MEGTIDPFRPNLQREQMVDTVSSLLKYPLQALIHLTKNPVCSDSLPDNRTSSQATNDKGRRNNSVQNRPANNEAADDSLMEPDNNGSFGDAVDDGLEEDNYDEPWGHLVPWESTNDESSNESGLDDDANNSTNDVAGIPANASKAPDGNKSDHLWK
jgi:hypothetical protein